MLLTGAHLVVNKNVNPKQIVSILTFESQRRLKVKVDEVGLLLRHLKGYYSVCFIKPVTPLRLLGHCNIVTISCCFENTRHFTQSKE